MRQNARKFVLYVQHYSHVYVHTSACKYGKRCHRLIGVAFDGVPQFFQNGCALGVNFAKVIVYQTPADNQLDDETDDHKIERVHFQPS